MTPGNWIAIAGILVTLCLAAYAFFYRLDRRVLTVESRCVNHQKVIDSIEGLTARLDKAESNDELFWKVIGPHLENIIHSPKSVGRDALVRKLNEGTITADELADLINLLREALNKPEWNHEKRFAGVLLMAWATQLMNTPKYDRRQERRSA